MQMASAALLPDFYPRPPRGGRPCLPPSFSHIAQFLSTPSARRATVVLWGNRIRRDISIHALREEGDLSTSRAHRCVPLFLSTPSARRATLPRLTETDNVYISIHALREEGDGRLREGGLTAQYFYPRPPRGGRRQTEAQISQQSTDFYPRPPRGGRRVWPAAGLTG